MGLFARRSDGEPEKRSMTIDAVGALARASRASYGVSFVDADSSMRHDAVWSCRTRIAQDISMMPVDVVRYVNDTRQSVTPLPQIIAAPSSVASALDWRYQVVDSWLADGNAWGIVTSTTAGGAYPTRIELVSPCKVRVDASTGTMTYFVNEQQEFLWPVGRLWHVPAYTVAGSPLGLSPIAYHRATIGAGLAAQGYGAGFFESGGHPTAIVKSDTELSADEAMAVKEAVSRATSTHEAAVFGSGLSYEAIQTDPKDSQFIETMRYSVEQICRIFGEDPADHGASAGGTAVTYANRTDADLARYKRRQFWVTKLQTSLSDLIPRPQVVKLNTSSALMMTDRERHELNKLRLDSKTRTVNEIRKLEDEPPFAGDEFDRPGVPGDAMPGGQAP
jgi:HK97 family phage portal protein